MAINVDLSRPLSADQIEHLKARVSKRELDRYIELAGQSDSEASEPATAPAGGSDFDPSKESVDAVLEHLLTADEAETERVLQAERDGKSRKGILEA